eukprot:363808-Chlamydomonas_euryale.AAC.5
MTACFGSLTARKAHALWVTGQARKASVHMLFGSLGRQVRRECTLSRSAGKYGASAQAAPIKRGAGGGRPPANPHRAPPHDPPPCHPRLLPPPLIRSESLMDLQTTMEGCTPPTDTSSWGLWKTPLASMHYKRQPRASGAFAGRHSSFLRASTGSHQAGWGRAIPTERATQADQLSTTLWISQWGESAQTSTGGFQPTQRSRTAVGKLPSTSSLPHNGVFMRTCSCGGSAQEASKRLGAKAFLSVSEEVSKQVSVGGAPEVGSVGPKT